jgi:excisionase family DNA binding protein
VRQVQARPALLDMDAVAAILGVTRRHVQRMVTERRIPYIKVGRFVRFDPGHLEVWLEGQKVEVFVATRRGRAVHR